MTVTPQDWHSPDWQTANQEYLARALAKVHAALQTYGERSPEKEPTSPEKEPTSPEKEPTNILESDIDLDFPAHLAPPALLKLCAAFGLSPFERDVLLLCAGVELSASVANLCATVQGNSQQGYPTFSLALAALPAAHWSAVAPLRPLRHWRLIEVNLADSLTQSRLRIDERVLHYLNGITYIDDRLSGLVQPVVITAELPPSHLQLVEQMMAGWQREAPLPIVQLCGNQLASQEAVALGACHRLGMALHRLRAAEVPVLPGDREALSRLWEREAIFSQSALLLDCTDLDPGTHRSLISLLETMQTFAIVLTREPLDLHRPTLRLTVHPPTPAEQQALWKTALGDFTPDFSPQLETLTSHFSLSPNTIRTISQEFRMQNSECRVQDADSLWHLCRTQARTRLDQLAESIQATANWDDLILPDSQKQTLHEIAAQVRQRSTVYQTWGFANKSANGFGISALFAGGSGTGKTMAAAVLAQELKLDLYRIDLSQVVSKYIGETEKNLRRVFDAAEMGGAILLFDEADALFGKRSEVKDSHDRYANIEVSYLLQRMETYRGLAILTTNLKSAIDIAFLRRIRFVVQFPFPDANQRTQIWQRIFPAQLPTQDLDYAKLAQLTITGGNIRTIALNAAFLAADRGEPLQMKHLLRAAQSEYTKLEKTLTDAETKNWL
jgi:ATPase family associated with various cellular activities (AAA)